MPSRCVWGDDNEGLRRVVFKIKSSATGRGNGQDKWFRGSKLHWTVLENNWPKNRIETFH